MCEADLDPDLVSMIDRLTRFFREDKIRFDEFASNVILHLFGRTSSIIDACLQNSTNEELSRIVDYMQAEIDEDKYLPFPVAFMDEEEINKKRVDSLPDYQKLLRIIVRKADS